MKSHTILSDVYTHFLENKKLSVNHENVDIELGPTVPSFHSTSISLRAVLVVILLRSKDFKNRKSKK